MRLKTPTARSRAIPGAHPDLTWVAPSGAHEILVSDIDQPVITAASKTPFESTRRVFVIERVDELGDESANRMLKSMILGAAESVPVDEAVGRVSAESIAGYPPGIPALLPGERVTAEVVAYLRELSAAGARLHGAADPAFRTVDVLREG